MEVTEAIEVALQVAEALAAAHAGGIVHRDLKPQNIMLTTDGRAKVVDFGLSKATVVQSGAEDETAARDSMTAPHMVIGTAGYMAPEQVAGLTADARADQFALGTILYEMLAGRRAFRRDTSIQTMAAILGDEPPSLAVVRPEVPDAVSALVTRCLAKKPEDRYPSTRALVRDLREALDVLMIESRTDHARAVAPPRRRWPLAAGIGVIALMATATGVVWSRREVTPVAGPAAATRPAVRHIVVLPFANVTRDPEDQIFADGLVETLTSSLTQLERFQRTLRVVPASEVRSARVASARDARQAFDAALVISGSVQRDQSTLRLTLNLVDVAAQAQLASRTIDMVAAAGTAVQDVVVGATTGLLALQLEPDEQRAMTAGGSVASGAYEAFVQGRGYLQRFDRGVENLDRAIAAFSRAVAVDPRFALAHAALGEAYWRRHEIDRDARWIEQAVAHCERALAIDSRLAPVHVTLALVARGRGRYEEAVAVAQRAIELDPTNSDGYRELGRAYEALERMPDAEATYRRAIEARPDDWMSYNTLGSFFYQRGRLEEAEAAYRRVTELTPDNTRGHNNLGAVFARLDRRDEAVAAWERSMAIRPTFSAASNLGTLHYGAGRYTEAARAFERATALAPTDFRVWRNLGAALYWAPGERDKATDAYERAVELAEEARKVNPRQPALLAQLADAYSMLGRRVAALDAAAAVERLGTTEPDALFNVASAYEQLGQRGRALEWLERALAAGYSADSVGRSPGLAELRKDPRFKVTPQ
jgi:tetratricopeptide (TPR) repeat protein